MDRKKEILNNDEKLEPVKNLQTSNQLNSGITTTYDNDKQDFASRLQNAELSQQAAIINLQQQANELKTATALKQQNDKLNQLLEVQTMKLKDQEKQFSTLITRQLERQSLVESQIQSQQNRIDNYIQVRNLVF